MREAQAHKAKKGRTAEVGHTIRSPFVWIESNQKQIRLFNGFADSLQKLGGWRTIDNPMIERQAQVHHAPNRDFIVADDWLFHDSSDAEYRAFRWVDDRCKAVDAEGI